MTAMNIKVNYARSSDQMIAAGQYKHTFGMEDFQIQGEGLELSEVKLFHFGRTMSSEAAVEEIKAAGFEPAKIEHLLAFGEKYPEKQKKWAIIALGSVAEICDTRAVPLLDSSWWYTTGYTRVCTVVEWDREWHDKIRFLGVRRRTQT